MQKYQDNVQNRNGDAVVGASVEVLTYPGGALATIYSDNGVTPATNPLTTDSNGAFSFYAADGRYSLEISGRGIQPHTITDISLAEELPPAIAGDLANTTDPLKGDALVGVKQPFTGAVAQTQHQKNARYIDALDAGAAGDGVTNDTAAFTLIDAAVSGQQVDLRGKTYLVDALPTGNIYVDGYFKIGGDSINMYRPDTMQYDVYVTVGPGGMFSTINDALRYLTTRYRKRYIKGSLTTTPGYTDNVETAKITLKTGFVMAEQVFVRQYDAGWITITAEDALVTIQRSALTSIAYFQGTGSEMYPAFYAGDNGALPIIVAKFQMDGSGTGTNRHWVVCNRNSSAHLWPFSGCLNSGGHGVYAREGSTISARLVDVSGAGDTGFVAANGSNLSAQGGTANNCIIGGVLSTDGSNINFAGGSATGAGQYGASCIEGSNMNASTATLTGAGADGIRCLNASKMGALQVNVSNAVTYGIRCESGSVVSADAGIASNCPTGVYASSSATVAFNSGTATGCSLRAIQAVSGSNVDALNAVLTGAGTNGILANINSRINANGANCQKGGSPATSDIAVGNGSIITAQSATGGTSIPINFWGRDGFIMGTNTVVQGQGTNTPEGAVTGSVGSIFYRTNGAASTVTYQKESGTGNTGWRALMSSSGVKVLEGSNAKQGVATLVAGSVVVSNTSITANSRIILTSNADGGTPGFLRVSARVVGTSFTITSSSGADTSTVAYLISEPA